MSGLKARLVPIAKIAAAILLGVIAIRVLAREFAATSFEEVAHALGSIGGQQVFIAALATLAAYAAVASYDALALYYAGRKLSFRRSAMSSTTTYAISNLLGFPVFTGNALRLWLYGHWGLGAAEVVIAAIVTTVVCNLVLAMIAGVSLIAEPGTFSDVLGIDPVWLAIIGWALVLAGVGAAAFGIAGPKRIRIGPFDHKRPGLVLLPHMLLCVVDYAATAGVLYALLGDALPIGFFHFVAMFSIAKTIGIVSNVPGGLGVFEAMIAAAMPGIPPASLAAALIAYRCIFYLAPFVVAAVFIAGHVLHRASRRTSPRQPSHPSP